jgi:hypothetical protein
MVPNGGGKNLFLSLFFRRIECMKIELTLEQYKTLAKAVYLGNWMANAERTGKVDDPNLKAYDDMADFIFSLAPVFGLPKDFEHILECGDHKSKTEVVRLQEAYDEKVFLAEFAERIGGRDFARKYGKDAIAEMSDDEYLLKENECITEVEEEVKKHGLDRVIILKLTTKEKSI